ncbi:MAG TPA: UDP-N-acetylmuramate dehydrogenase [Ilumatobacteraceae bacterium]
MSAIEVAPVEQAAAVLGSLARRDVPIGPMTTYRVGGAAALFVRASSIEDLRVVAAAVQASAVPVLIVGRGSNLLVADEGFDGLAVALGDIGDRLDMNGLDVEAGAGLLLPVLARRTAAASLTGLEWAVGVPGSVGGAVRMNAGGHGSDIAATLQSVDLVDLATGAEAQGVPVERLGLRFRGSSLGDQQIVVRARFRLAAGDRAASEREIAEIVRWRREHQPGGQNAGSVFVNPIPGQLAAGELVDDLGLRGFRIGTAHVSDKHANFIQADDGGRAADVRAVIEHVRARVAAEHGITLRSEVRLVGFADSPVPAPGIELP